MRIRSRVIVRAACLGVIVASARVAEAQCSDGSAPPCRVATVATTRRPDPPLDARTWIVLPFELGAPSPDMAWMRDASANLLYLDMSRWTDVRVIDDERVFDLLRDTPGATAQPLPLSTALAVARRAGAGRLVMGDLLRAGSRTQVIAKIFDVKDGRRLRSLREEATSPDSMFGVFTKLARGVLDVAPPPGARLGDIGTRSVDAYQAYLEGIRALNGFDLPASARQFRRAIQLDSSFALAHYKLALGLLWAFSGDTLGRVHAERALQLSTGLPLRERTLIRAFAHYPRREYNAMCEAIAPLLKADSSDVEALGGMADCLFHDVTVVPAAGDTSKRVFRGDYNASLRLFRRALDLDPTYHLAYQHFIDVYLRDFRTGTGTDAGAAAATPYFAMLRRGGDSLVLQPIRSRTFTPPFDSARTDYLKSGMRARNLATAKAVVDEWLAAAPSAPKAQISAARVYSALGLPRRARELLPAGGLTGSDSSNLPFMRLDLALRMADGVAVAQMADSTIAARKGATDFLNVIASAGSGRMGAWDTFMSAQQMPPGTNPRFVRYNQLLFRAALGIAVDSAVALEAELWGQPGGTSPYRFTSSLVLAFRQPRTKWPTLDSVALTDVRFRPAAAMARNDTAALRRAAQSLDSLARASRAQSVGDATSAFVAADAFAALGDSANALRTVRWALDTAMTMSEPTVFSAAGVPLLLPQQRAMLLRADLAAAAGARDEARIWYRHMLDFWAHADPDFQPLIERIRKSYAALGGT